MLKRNNFSFPNSTTFFFQKRFPTICFSFQCSETKSKFLFKETQQWKRFILDLFRLFPCLGAMRLDSSRAKKKSLFHPCMRGATKISRDHEKWLRGVELAGCDAVRGVFSPCSPLYMYPINNDVVIDV